MDAILIGAKVLEFFQSIISRRIDPREEAVITIGSFKGGEVNNIVCDKVEMLGTIRTMSFETREYIKETTENPNLETEILEVGDGLAISKMKSNKKIESSIN